MRLVRTICESQKALKKLNENTALYFMKQRKDAGKNQSLGQLFQKLRWQEDGRIEFQFSDLAAPYIFDYSKTSITLK